MQRIDAFRRMAGAIGPGNAILYALARGLDTLFGDRFRLVKYYFVSQPVRTVGNATGTGKFRIDWAERENSLLGHLGRPSFVIDARFRQGARCLAATIGEGKLAGCLWFVVGPYEEDEVRARFVPTPARSVAWDFDVTILPEYRMGRLFGYLWSRAAAELHALGVTHSCSRISAFNAASLASHRRLNAEMRGSATFLCLGSLQFMVSTLAPWLHVSWGCSRRPVIVVPA